MEWLFVGDGDYEMGKDKLSSGIQHRMQALTPISSLSRPREPMTNRRDCFPQLALRVAHRKNARFPGAVRSDGDRGLDAVDGAAPIGLSALRICVHDSLDEINQGSRDLE